MKRAINKDYSGMEYKIIPKKETSELNPTKQELLPCEPFAVPLIELSYTNPVKPSERPFIPGSDAAYRLLNQLWDKQKIEMQEQFKVVLLNRSHKVLGVYELSTGGTTSTTADPRLIFAAALKANAGAIILAHNHPSGKLNASNGEKELTRRMKEAGKLLEINVLDHIIVTSDGYFSFAEEGLI